MTSSDRHNIYIYIPYMCQIYDKQRQTYTIHNNGIHIYYIWKKYIDLPQREYACPRGSGLPSEVQNRVAYSQLTGNTEIAVTG